MADYQQYLTILDADPGNAQALAALEQIASSGGGLSPAGKALDDARRAHRERGDLELVARLFDVELLGAPDSDRRASLLFEKGKLLFDELLSEDEAVECFRRVLELRPDDPEAQEQVAHIGLVREN